MLLVNLNTFDFPWFPLLVFVLDLHINPYGECQYLDGLWGFGLLLHLVVGWKRKYVVRNRILDSQNGII